MDHPIQDTFRGRLGESLRTSRLAVLLELIVVFVPLQVLLMIGNRLGEDFIPLGGDIVVLGSPVAWVGAVLGFGLAWVALVLRGSGWRELGMARPKSRIRTMFLAMGVFVVIMVALVAVVETVAVLFPGAPPPDHSRFDPLRGNLANLLFNLVAVWITAAFLEEMLWRGFLMNRLAGLLGKTKLGWAVALVGSAIIFGCAHFYQGPTGMVLTGFSGLLFGGVYLAGRCNLWLVILAHGFIDTLNYVLIFLNIA